MKKSIPQIKFFLMCDKAIVNKAKHDYLGCFDTINTLILPSLAKGFDIIVGFVLGQGEFDFRLKMFDPQGNELPKGMGPEKIKLKDPFETTKVIINVRSMQLKSSGTYWIHLFLDDKPIGKHYFTVNKLEVKSKYTKEEKAKILANKDLISSIRANITCPKCKKESIFELNLDPAASFSEDLLPLPEEDEILCPGCRQYKFDLKDMKANVWFNIGRPKPKGKNL